jgi:methionyl-tRNA formyltransferase
MLDERMAKIAVLGLLEAIPGYISGALKPIPQDDSKATITRQLTREDGCVNWQKTAQEIYNQWRGLMPWPGVWTIFENKRVKLLKIMPTDKTMDCGLWTVGNGQILVGCNGGAIEIEELQMEGGKPMNAGTFLNGYGKILNLKS